MFFLNQANQVVVATLVLSLSQKVHGWADLASRLLNFKINEVHVLLQIYLQLAFLFFTKNIKWICLLSFPVLTNN